MNHPAVSLDISFFRSVKGFFFVLFVVYLLSFKNCEAIEQVKGKRRSGRPKILPTLVKQYLKVISLNFIHLYMNEKHCAFN